MSKTLTLKSLFSTEANRETPQDNMVWANAGKRDEESFFSAMPKEILRILNKMTE